MQEYLEVLMRILDTDLIKTDNMRLKAIVEATPIVILAGSAVFGSIYYLDRLSRNHGNRVATPSSEYRK